MTDDNDRRTLITYLDEYMGDFLFDKNTQFMFAKTPEFQYALPEENNQEGFLNYIGKLPVINSPDVFGLHPNAEITYFTNSAKKLWDNILAMQSSDSSSSSSGSSSDDFITQTASGIQEKIPELYDVVFLRKEAGTVISPSKVVLF